MSGSQFHCNHVKISGSGTSGGGAGSPASGADAASAMDCDSPSSEPGTNQAAGMPSHSKPMTTLSAIEHNVGFQALCPDQAAFAYHHDYLTSKDTAYAYWTASRPSSNGCLSHRETWLIMSFSATAPSTNSLKTV